MDVDKIHVFCLAVCLIPDARRIADVITSIWCLYLFANIQMWLRCDWFTHKHRDPYVKDEDSSCVVMSDCHPSLILQFQPRSTNSPFTVTIHFNWFKFRIHKWNSISIKIKWFSQFILCTKKIDYFFIDPVLYVSGTGSLNLYSSQVKKYGNSVSADLID